jgi:hypothetical protein
MRRRTEFDRDLVDVPIALRRGPRLARAVDIVERFAAKHGSIPRDVLEAFGEGQRTRGWNQAFADLHSD